MLNIIIVGKVHRIWAVSELFLKITLETIESSKFKKKIENKCTWVYLWHSELTVLRLQIGLIRTTFMEKHLAIAIKNSYIHPFESAVLLLGIWTTDSSNTFP